MDKNERLIRAGFAAFLLFLGICYWPGVSGGFIFDDAHNLKNLGAFGPVADWRTFLLYISSGNADPTGRPISMLSFLWDATNWPADARQFKQTNILIHLLNSALLFRSIQILETKLGSSQKIALTTSAVASALWAAHPLFVSTTLYVVQRHAMLPLTFILLAWISWSRVEIHCEAGKIKHAWLWAIFGVLGMTCFAGLSKANGLLAPLLILVSFGILNVGRKSFVRPEIRALILYLPAFALLLYLVLQTRYGFDANWGRDFTLGERLLTQPRILFTYLYELYLPGNAQTGFYFGDTIYVSKSLTSPITTAYSLIGLFTLVGFCACNAKNYPRFAIAALWFVLAHLVESSTIMLELFFEHRNYVPSIFLFLPIAHWFTNGKSIPKVRIALIIIIPALLLASTYNKAVIWGSPLLQAKIWSESNVESYRNAINLASNASLPEDIDESKKALKDLIRKNPKSTNLYLGLIGAECMASGSSNETWENAYLAARSDREFNVGTVQWLSHAVRASRSGACKNFDREKLLLLLNAFLANPSIKKKGSTESIIYHLKGYLYSLNGEYKLALENYNKAIEIDPDPNFVLTQAAQLGNVNQESVALEHIAFFKSLESANRDKAMGMQRLHQLLIEHYQYYDLELIELESKLKKNAKSMP